MGGACTCPATQVATSGEEVTGKGNDAGLLGGSGERIYVAKKQLESGAEYTGQLLNGERDGEGTTIWQDGAKYEGQWVQGKAQGKGTFNHMNGDLYQGEWYQDRAHGYGKYFHCDGAMSHWPSYIAPSQ